MYLNDLNSAQHSVSKLNKILADTFNHEVDLSSMNYESLNKMLSTTNAKMTAIKESDLKYWENAQYNKLGLIQHQLKTYITEIAPTRKDGKKMKKENVVMEADLDQAEVLLAAQELVDEMQKMVEDVAEMQVQKLMPIVDAMKQQVGFEVAEAYNNAADAALGGLLDQMKGAKEALENATLTARGEQPTAPAPTDMAMSDADMDPEAPMDMETPDEFGGDEAEAGEENPVGRELKGESAIADIEKGALAEKKFHESKDRLFKMVESGAMTHEHFINVINQLTEQDPYMGQDYGKYYPTPGGSSGGGGGTSAPKFKMDPSVKKYQDSLKKKSKPAPMDTGIGALPPSAAPMPGLPKGDPLIHGGEPKGKGGGSGPGLPKGDPLIHGGEPKSPGKGGGKIPKALDDRPFNRFAPPPTGPGGDAPLPKPKKKPQRGGSGNQDQGRALPFPQMSPAPLDNKPMDFRNSSKIRRRRLQRQPAVATLSNVSTGSGQRRRRTK